MEISKKDWKLYQIKLGKWQENYIDRLNQEYITLLSNKEKAPSEKFWELEKRLKKDRRHPGVIIDVQKSTAIWTQILLRYRLSHEMIWKALAVS